ncbi:SIMPL domain-containing protein [Shewanella gelidii]|uniref:SIMPL domain-containing protein n=1 Tax=Shewanella gelidii TaxID=1642821 RepID=A0A917NAL3_9GAMM|nr:SIMPL domain-containing protein [Shewanella gelidii]MCL1098213.1 SIMPL domain-containing protein [Shewanella gelidii]GGI83441.1 SIMPL domain-containing protein [Shewanella gelidii]
MDKSKSIAALILGGLISFGIITFGVTTSNAVIDMKALERTVTVKGLAEREVKANIAIWPIQFIQVDNDLTALYQTAQEKTERVVEFLNHQGFHRSEITLSLPSIEDRQAQGYVNPNVRFRYAAKVTVSVYTEQVDLLLATRTRIIELAKDGIAITTQNYDGRTEFLFTKLNEIKPQMVQLATQNGRQVAEKFAKDSESKLGKIKRASQGQFSINDRDSNTPHMKRVRVVSTLTYYLKD